MIDFTKAREHDRKVEENRLRDYFAAKVLPSIYEVAMIEASDSGLLQHDDWRVGLALDAYAMADAMMKARQS